LKMQQIDPASEQGKEMLKQQQPQVLESLIMAKVVKQKAETLKLLPEKAKLDAEVNKKLDELKGKYTNEAGKPDEAKFKDALKQANLTIDQLKALISDEVVNDKVRAYIVKDIKIDDSKVKEYYDMYGQLKYTEKPNTMHLQHILTKTEDEAKKVKERLTKGEDFATVAKEVSTDPSAKENGGDLGIVNYDGSTESGSQLIPEFMKGALPLAKGAISNPVKTEYGFHIIKCIDKTEYPVKAYDKVKEEIRTTLLEEAQNKKVTETLEKWKKEAKIETKKYEKNLE